MISAYEGNHAVQ